MLLDIRGPYRGRTVLGLQDVSARAMELLSKTSSLRRRGGWLEFAKDYNLVRVLQEECPFLELTPPVKAWMEANEGFLLQRAQLQLEENAAADERLWPFQKRGINYLIKGRKTLLADEPGLGKTAQAICAVKESGKYSRVLVLCPSSLKNWWADETHEWFPEVETLVVSASTRAKQYGEFEKGFFIANWELVYRFPELLKSPWDWLICDEAHRIKNRKTRTFRSLKRLKAARVVLITATPFGNHPGELWSLLNYLFPDRYSSYWRFFELFVDYFDIGLGREVRGTRHPEMLREALSGIMLRRTKEEVGIHLLPKKRRRISLDLTEEQKKLYREIAQNVWVELEDGEILTATTALVLLMRFRQIVSTTATVTTEDHSSKLDAMVELVEDSGEEPWVVFTQFRATVHCLKRRLEEKGISCITALGGMGHEAVNEAVRSFQEGEAQVFAATMQTGGVGVTLTRASQLVLLDKWFNPDVQEQAEDRIHRIGQERQAVITELLCPGTVDDLIERILNRKLSMKAEILGHLRRFI